MRLIDRYGHDIVDVTWSKATTGKWVTKQIPIGQKIVGVIASQTEKPFILPRIAFLLREENYDP